MDFGMPALIELSSLRENAELCSQLDLDFIELNMNLPYCQLSKLSEEWLIAGLRREYGCYFTLHLDETLDPFCFNQLVAQAWEQTALDAAALALREEMPIINMHLQKGIYFTLPDRKEYLYRTHRDAYLASVARFRDSMANLLTGSSTVLCIENTSGYTDFQREAIEMMLEKDCFALTWDIGHSFCAGESDMDYLSRERAERLGHMHFHDAAGSSPHLPLGTGKLPLSDRLAVAGDHNCRCVIEVKTADSLTQSIRYLRERLTGS